MNHEVFDKEGKPIDARVIPDGAKLRVHLTMMDSAPPEIAALTRQALADAESQPALHQPGHAVLSDEQRSVREKMFADRDSRLSSAWKQPPPLPAPAGGIPHQTNSAEPASGITDAAAAHAARVPGSKMPGGASHGVA